MMRDSPFSESSTVGTADRGARSECALVRPGLRGGELERMPVLDVGMGVGYFRRSWLPVFWRFSGRGRPGDEDSGSKGGSKDGAGRLEPARLIGVVDEGVIEVLAVAVVVGRGAGSVGSMAGVGLGGESIVFVFGESWRRVQDEIMPEMG